MTKKQLALIHTFQRTAELNDAQYRMVLRNVGGVESSKQLTQVGFETVMAVLEEHAEARGASVESYWRDRHSQAGVLCGARAVHKICELAPQQRYSLEALALRFSDGRTEDPRELTPREAFNLIEMLKSVIGRDGTADASATDSQGTEARQHEQDLFGGAAAQL